MPRKLEHLKFLKVQNCVVFLDPKKPATRSDPEKIKKELEKVDLQTLLEKAVTAAKINKLI